VNKKTSSAKVILLRVNMFLIIILIDLIVRKKCLHPLNLKRVQVHKRNSRDIFYKKKLTKT